MRPFFWNILWLFCNKMMFQFHSKPLLHTWKLQIYVVVLMRKCNISSRLFQNYIHHDIISTQFHTQKSLLYLFLRLLDDSIQLVILFWFFFFLRFFFIKYIHKKFSIMCHLFKIIHSWILSLVKNDSRYKDVSFKVLWPNLKKK